jgi:hypothetical protein
MNGSLSLRLVICMNECPVGLRLERGDPLPVHQHTYDDSPEGRALAEQHLERIADYVRRHQKPRKISK